MKRETVNLSINSERKLVGGSLALMWFVKYIKGEQYKVIIISKKWKIVAWVYFSFGGNLTPSHHLIVMVGNSNKQNFVLRRTRNNFILILWQVGLETIPVFFLPQQLNWNFTVLCNNLTFYKLVNSSALFVMTIMCHSVIEWRNEHVRLFVSRQSKWNYGCLYYQIQNLLSKTWLLIG